MPPEPDAQETSRPDYTAVLRRRRWLLVLPTLVAPLVALGLSLSQESRYRSSAEVLVQEPPSATSIGEPDRPMEQRVLQNELQRARGSALLDDVREVIGPEPVLSVRLAAAEDTDVFVFTAESIDPESAARAANAYADIYVAERRRSLVEALGARIDLVEDRLAELADDLGRAPDEERELLTAEQRQSESELAALAVSIELAESSGATVIDAAPVPEGPFEPRLRRVTLLALVAGALIGLAAAFLVERFDHSIHDEDDLLAASGAPVLAVIPTYESDGPPDAAIITRTEPQSQPAEAYRALRTSVQFMATGRPMRTLQITSARPGDGKTTTAVNLAVAAARASRRVVLLDCDLRRPRVHDFFGVPNDPGFTTAMIGASLDEVAVPIEGEPGLWVVPSGSVPPDPSELLSTPAATMFIRGLTEQFDLVVIDTPPVLVVADPLIVAAAADAVVLVASADSTDRRQIAAAAHQLRQIDAPLVGTVLNNFDLTSSSTYEYRYAYGRYGEDA